MAYEDIYKGLTEEEKERMIKADIPKFVVIGHSDFTEEEKRENDKSAERILRKFGHLKPDEHIINNEVVRINENGEIEKGQHLLKP